MKYDEKIAVVDDLLLSGEGVADVDNLDKSSVIIDDAGIGGKKYFINRKTYN